MKRIEVPDTDEKRVHFCDPYERTVLFVDGPNIVACARDLGWDIDWAKVLRVFSRGTRLRRAFYYTAIAYDENPSLRGFVDWLSYHGWTVVTKPAKRIHGENGRKRIEGNMDVEIAIDMVEMSRKVDHVVLFSGDADFVYAVRHAQKNDTRVTVVSTASEDSWALADELRRRADFFIDLDDLRPYIERTDTAPVTERTGMAIAFEEARRRGSV